MLMLLEAAPGLSTELVGQFVQLVKTVIGLYSEYPLNICLIAGLCSIALSVFAVARRATH